MDDASWRRTAATSAVDKANLALSPLVAGLQRAAVHGRQITCGLKTLMSSHDSPDCEASYFKQFWIAKAHCSPCVSAPPVGPT